MMWFLKEDISANSVTLYINDEEKGAVTGIKAVKKNLQFLKVSGYCVYNYNYVSLVDLLSEFNLSEEFNICWYNYRKVCLSFSHYTFNHRNLKFYHY
jgi:hypothetical protein